MRECVSTGVTSAPSSAGPGPCRTSSGGSRSCATGAAPGFWHETCFRGGQVESVYIDMPGTGLAGFAPVTPARGSLFSARRRLGMREGREPPPGIADEELYQR